MKDIIRALYNGTLSPADKNLMSNPDIKKKTVRLVEIEERLDTLISGEAKKLFEELAELQTDIVILAGEDRFTDGFKMGVRIATESLYDKNRR
ncbi:MAG TPA: hypothetical protein DD738_13895 [Ruminiclostridium sp.]|nr:hypothetical protein [Ruminiclostridium sp.]